MPGTGTAIYPNTAGWTRDELNYLKQWGTNDQRGWALQWFADEAIANAGESDWTWGGEWTPPTTGGTFTGTGGSFAEGLTAEQIMALLTDTSLGLPTYEQEGFGGTDEPGEETVSTTSFLGQSLKNLGLEDYTKFFGQGVGEAAGKHFGLPIGFEQFFIPFQQEKFETMMGKIEPWAEKQRGYIGRKFEGARSGLQGTLLGESTRARQLAGGAGFAGAGAGQRAEVQARKEAGTKFAGLKLGRKMGLEKIGEEAEERTAMGESLLADYLKGAYQTALTIKGFDPAGGKQKIEYTYDIDDPGFVEWMERDQEFSGFRSLSDEQIQNWWDLWKEQSGG